MSRLVPSMTGVGDGIRGPFVVGTFLASRGDIAL
jgi:hypothetical protein